MKNPRKIEIKGPKGDEFVAVAHCGYCVNTIYTKYPVAVGEQRSIGSQRTADAQCCLVDFTWENAEEVREVIRKWNL